MTPQTLPIRPVSPADRPPPRDPKAAGGSGDSTEASFSAVLKDAAEPTQREAGNAEIARPEQALTHPEPKEAQAGTTTGEALERPAPEAAALLAPDPHFAVAPLPPPGQPAPAPSLNSPTTGAQDNKAAAPAPLVATPRKPVLDLLEPKLAGKSEPAKTEARDFAALINDKATSLDGNIAPGANTPAAPRPVETAPAPPPMAAPMASPQMPVAALPAAIAIRALEGLNRFDIRLDPEDLGRIDVALEIDGDGNIRAAIAADKPEALQLIVREARALEQAFDQAGFRRDDNALSFSLSDHNNSPSQSQQDQPARPQGTRFFVDGDTETLPPALTALLSPADGRLDVRI